MRIVLAHGTDGIAHRYDRPPPQGRPRGPRAAMIAHDPTGIFGTSTALQDILLLAGPETAPRILQQMHEDLSSVAALLLPAIACAGAPAQSGPNPTPAPDWPQIRRQTHVLISLAGTIGAMRLHALAIELNTAAHDQDAPRVRSLVPPLRADLIGLITLIAQRLPGKGAVA